MQHFFFNREMLAIPDTGLCFQDPVIQDQQYFNVKQSHWIKLDNTLTCAYCL